MAAIAPQDVKRIVIVRANGLGDYIFALPALWAIRERFPDAEITHVGLSWHARELSRGPGPADRYVTAPHWPGVNGADTGGMSADDAEEAGVFFAGMRGLEFDLGVQMHGGGSNSNPFLLAMRPAFSVGTCTSDAKRLDSWLPFDHYQHEVVRWSAVAGLAGAPVRRRDPHWEVTGKDADLARELLPPDGRRLAVVDPGAGSGRRRWPPECFAAVCDRLLASGARVAIVGDAGDADTSARIARRAQWPVDDLTGQTTVRVLAAMLARASVVVANDSGPLHLARATGSPTVGIYWSGNVITAGPLNVLKHRIAISWRTACPVCGVDCTRDNCDHDASFVEEVPVDEVAEKALDLLRRFGHADQVPAMR